MELVNTELNLFCPRKSCAHYQEPANPTWKKGTYPVLSEEERRQLFWCSGGKHKFSETSFSDLWHKHGSFKEYEQTAKLLKCGLATVEIADVLQKDERTICTWKQAINGKSQAFHLWICCQIGIIVSFLQMDELWSYVCNKSRQLWVFAALDVPTRFWITLVTGKRTSTTAKRLVDHVYDLGTWSKHRLLRITTDKLAAYTHAISTYFQEDVRYVYLQIVKQRVKRRLKTVSKAFIQGGQDDFPTGTQNTSFIERLNLTIRDRVSYLCRKTMGYCKKSEAMDQTLWINLVDYNYCCFHKSLRVRLPGCPKQPFKKRYRMSTPAMKMGLSNDRLNWKYLFLIPVPS